MRTSVPSSQPNGTLNQLPGFSRLFEDLFNTYPFQPTSFDRSEGWTPPADIFERDDNLVIRVEVPGVSEKDIDVKLEGNVLTLKGERKRETDDHSKYYLTENSYGTFSRSITLPETADSEHIKADYKNGVLTIMISQRPEAKPRSIPVFTS